MNFLSNAIKFTDSGYVLAEVEAAEVVLDKHFIRISVHDTGMGISQQNLGHLFTRFRQADPTITRRFGGTGLGLAIVKQIVEWMGGELSVTSSEGEGSTFSCKIPLKLDRAQARAPLNSAALAGVSVLVGGGQQIARFVVAEWCQRWEMNVQQCDLAHLPHYLKSAAEDARNFQLVILDGSVNALFKAISDFRACVGVPVPRLVLLSADSLEQTKHLQADAILSTPVRAKILCEKLCELVPGARVQPWSTHGATGTVASQPSSLSGVKVLVTDDNLVNQKLACALLARLGCQVDTADSGEEAVEKASSNEYALVFMDCVMPGMDGFEATTAIRNLASHLSTVPIVALTASATAEDRDHCFAVGMNDFLTKPIRSEQLAACLTKWRNLRHRAATT
jgi:CheY-like chemotaxis protein